MAWTKTTRKQYRRDGLRYASDTTDKEWKLLRPLLPKRARIGRPPEWGLRIILDLILYLVSTGCQWRACRKTFRRSPGERAAFRKKLHAPTQ